MFVHQDFTPQREKKTGINNRSSVLMMRSTAPMKAKLSVILLLSRALHHPAQGYADAWTGTPALSRWGTTGVHMCRYKNVVLVSKCERDEPQLGRDVACAAV